MSPLESMLENRNLAVAPLRYYFETISPLWRAVRAHLLSPAGPELLADPRVVDGVEVLDAFPTGDSADHFCLALQLTSRGVHSTLHYDDVLILPHALDRDFTPEGFSAWLEHAKRDAGYRREIRNGRRL